MKKITLLLLATTTVAFPMDNPEEMKGFENRTPSVAQPLSEILPESLIEKEGGSSKSKLADPIQETKSQTTLEQRPKTKVEKIKEYLSKKNIKYATYVIIPLGSYYIFKDTINKLAVSAVERLFSKSSGPGPSASLGSGSGGGE